MTTSPDETTAEPATPPDPLHEPSDEPRFQPGEPDDTPEVPMPDADEDDE